MSGEVIDARSRFGAKSNAESGSTTEDAIAEINHMWSHVLLDLGATLADDGSGDFIYGELRISPNHIRNVGDILDGNLSPEVEEVYRKLYEGAPILEGGTNG